MTICGRGGPCAARDLTIDEVFYAGEIKKFANNLKYTRIGTMPTPDGAAQPYMSGYSAPESTSAYT